MADPGFSRGGGANSKRSYYLATFFPKNCMELKEFGPPGGGVPGAPLRTTNGDTYFRPEHYLNRVHQQYPLGPRIGKAKPNNISSFY